MPAKMKSTAATVVVTNFPMSWLVAKRVCRRSAKPKRRWKNGLVRRPPTTPPSWSQKAARRERSRRRSSQAEGSTELHRSRVEDHEEASNKGFDQCGNAQAVANEDQIIVSADVTDQANDCRQVEPMVAQTLENLDAIGVTENIGSFTADAGYFSEENVTSLGSERTH